MDFWNGVWLQLAARVPIDGGPVYAETDLSRFPVEPWNTVSLIPFLFIPAYWIWKLRSDWRRNRLIALSIPLLLIGFIGGVLYHATRSNRLWFQMDYIPIALLAFIGAIAFWMQLWTKYRRSFVYAAGISVVTFLLTLVVSSEIQRQTSISLAYVHLAFVILLPAFLLSANREWLGVGWLAGSGLLFGLAIGCRIFDFHPGVLGVLPMGSHFLWHLFGAGAAFCVLQFLYLLKD